MQILFTALLLALNFQATAATCSRTLTFSDGAVLTAAQLNAELNAITNCANSLNNDNISNSAAILPSKLDSTIAGDAIARDGSSGVLSVGVDNSTIETNSDQIRVKDSGISAAKIASDAVTTVKILDSNVTTDKIADDAVTTAKLGSLGQQISSTSGNFTTSSASFTAATNMSVSLTTYGRPVDVKFIAATTNVLAGSSAGAFSNCYYRIKRGSTTIVEGVASPATSALTPASSISFIDATSAGTYTYSLEVARVVAGDCGVQEVKMVAYEL